MPKNEPKTASTMLFEILHTEKGLFFSRFELQIMILERYDTNVRKETLLKIIKQMPSLATRIERRGPKRIPIKLYSIP